MPIHDLDFSHGGFQGLPLCRRCHQEVTGEAWATDEACPGAPTCTPPAIHIFLDGRQMSCRCGAVDYGALVDLHSGSPIPEVGTP